MATLKALQEKIAKLQAQAEMIARKESSAVVGKIRSLMEKHGLTPDDIAAHFRKPAAGGKSGAAKKTTAGAGVAKYLNPKTGATWTGHGRAPAWIANVRDRSKFLADEGSVSVASTPDKNTKAGNYVRGPQAPKYRDPVSGATWSGRGPAPAWLANAKNRDTFLIAHSGAAASSAATKTAKKAAAKKVTAKKAPAKKAVSTKSAAKKATAKTSPVTKKATAKKAATKRVAVKKSAGSVAETTAATPAAEQSNSTAA